MTDIDQSNEQVVASICSKSKFQAIFDKKHLEIGKIWIEHDPQFCKMIGFRIIETGNRRNSRGRAAKFDGAVNKVLFLTHHRKQFYQCIASRRIGGEMPTMMSCSIRYIAPNISIPVNLPFVEIIPHWSIISADRYVCYRLPIQSY